MSTCCHTHGLATPKANEGEQTQALGGRDPAQVPAARIRVTAAEKCINRPLVVLRTPTVISVRPHRPGMQEQRQNQQQRPPRDRRPQHPTHQWWSRINLALIRVKRMVMVTFITSLLTRPLWSQYWPTKQPLDMEVNTGAALSIISESTYYRLWPAQAPPLCRSTKQMYRRIARG